MIGRQVRRLNSLFFPPRKQVMNRFGSLAVRAITLIVWLVPVIVLTAPAAAQGTSNTVPDPISVRDLEGYCERLGLSDQQRQAVAEMHDAYRAEFAKLRETEIEKFLQETRSLQSMGFAALQQRDQVVKSLKDMDTVLDRIRTVDNRMFDQVQTVLTEEQTATMPRVRQTRERQRYASGLTQMATFMNPATRIDVSQIVLDLDVPSEAMQTVDPLLMSYESSLTSDARKLHEATTKMMLDMLDKLAAAGINEESMRDNERRGQMWTTIRDAWGEVNAQLLEKASEISELNRKTVRSIGQVMPETVSRELRDEYFQRAYPEASVGGSTAKTFEAALKLEDLTPEQRQTLSAMAVEYRTSSDRIADQMADLIDENRRTRSMFDFNPDRQREYQDKLNEMRTKRTTLTSTAMDTLKATLGPELTEQVEKYMAAAEAESTTETRVFTSIGPGMGGMAAVRVATAAGGAIGPVLDDPYLPGPITERVASIYATQLGIDADGKVIYDSLYEDYRERFATVTKNDVQAVLDANGKLWSVQPGSTEMNPPSGEDIDRLFSLRKKALQSIMLADDGFFEEVKTTLLTEKDDAALKRVKLARQREVYNRVPGGTGGMFFGATGPGGAGRSGRGNSMRPPRSFGMFGGSSEESTVDVAMLLDTVEITTDERAAIDAALTEYEQKVTESFRKQYETNLRMRQAMDKAMAANMQARAASAGNSGGDRAMQMGVDMRQVMENDGRAAREVRTEITALNRAARDKIMAAISPTAKEEFRRAYNRKAYAEIFNDPQSANQPLTAALRLDDLSLQQRSNINDLSVEYHGAYDKLSEQMVELQINTPEFGGFGPGGGGGSTDWQAMQDRQRSMEKLNFDRNDLNDKTLAQLKVVLTDEQAQRIGADRDSQGGQ
jgi:hypothetical protein